MTGNVQEPSRSRLLDAIRGALAEHPGAYLIHVSLSAQAVDESFDGRIHSIKWVAWSLCNEAGEPITESQLDLVGPEHTKAEFEQDFAEFFPNQSIYVDHDISFDDE